MNTTTIFETEWEWQPDMASWTNDKGEAITNEEMSIRRKQAAAPEMYALLDRIITAGYRYTEGSQMYVDIETVLAKAGK